MPVAAPPAKAGEPSGCSGSGPPEFFRRSPAPRLEAPSSAAPPVRRVAPRVRHNACRIASARQPALRSGGRSRSRPLPRAVPPREPALARAAELPAAEFPGAPPLAESRRARAARPVCRIADRTARLRASALRNRRSSRSRPPPRAVPPREPAVERAARPDRAGRPAVARAAGRRAAAFRGAPPLVESRRARAPRPLCHIADRTACLRAPALRNRRRSRPRPPR